MPHVIHIVRKFEPAEWGGTETHLVALIRELNALGWTNEVHAPQEHGTDGSSLVSAGAAFRTFRARYPYLRMTPERRAALVAAGGNLVSMDELARLLFNRDAHVLHLHTLGRLGGVARTAARMRGIPYAVTLHGPVRAHADVVQGDAVRRTHGMVDVGAPFGLAVGARRVVHDADLVYVLNQAERNAWAKDRGERHLEVVSHGVTLERSTAVARQDARSSVAGLGEAPFLVVIARLDRGKGQDVAVRAFLRSAPPDWHLVLAGSVSDTTFAAEVQTLAAAQHDRIHLLGGVTPRIARALLAEAHLALIPSRSEPFGIVLLEAWAEGTPALIADVGGLGDIARRTGATDWLASSGDEDAWSERIRRVAGEGDDVVQERSRVRDRVAAHFSWRKLAERIAAGYEQARALRQR